MRGTNPAPSQRLRRPDRMGGAYAGPATGLRFQSRVGRKGRGIGVLLTTFLVSGAGAIGGN